MSSDLQINYLQGCTFHHYLVLTAVVEGFEEKYEIIKPSFWKTDIAIRKYGYDMTFASLTTNFFRTKGTIDLQNGKKLNLKIWRI